MTTYFPTLLTRSTGLPRIGGGQVAAFEVLVATYPVRNLIREGKTHQVYGVMQGGKKFGMTTMDASLATLVAQGRVTKDVAIRNASVPDELIRMIGSGSGATGQGGGAGGPGSVAAVSGYAAHSQSSTYGS